MSGQDDAHWALAHLYDCVSSDQMIYPVEVNAWMHLFMLLPWGDPRLMHCSAFVTRMFLELGLLSDDTTMASAVSPIDLCTDGGWLVSVRWRCRPPSKTLFRLTSDL